MTHIDLNGTNGVSVPTHGEIARSVNDDQTTDGIDAMVLMIKNADVRMGSHWFVTLVQRTSVKSGSVEWATYTTFSDGSCSQGHYYGEFDKAARDFEDRDC